MKIAVRPPASPPLRAPRTPSPAVAEDQVLLSTAAAYPGYAGVGEQLQQLAERYPELAQRISLGKSVEGRDIWALRIGSREQGEKPGVVITGCHHAREWATVTVPLTTARNLLENYDRDPAMKKRVDGAVTWIVPLVNPDGYEFSRHSDALWRKNRRPSERPDGFGVDLNRNYGTGKPEHAHLFRSRYDQPDLVSDDPLGCSDSPIHLTYRGPGPASEPETRAMQKLELDPANNIKAVLDLHSHGEMILHPYSYDTLTVERLDEYLTVGTAMNQTLDYRYKLMPGCALYPVPGTSNDLQHAHGILGMTMELGTCYQPDAKALAQLDEQVQPAQLAFLDGVQKLSQPHDQKLAKWRFQLMRAGDSVSRARVLELAQDCGLPSELASQLNTWLAEADRFGTIDFENPKVVHFLHLFVRAAGQPGSLQNLAEVLFEYGSHPEHKDRISAKGLEALVQAAGTPAGTEQLRAALEPGQGWLGLNLHHSLLRQQLQQYR